jgi:hypothetical protein
MAHLDVSGMQVGALALGAHGDHLPHGQLIRTAGLSVHRDGGSRVVMDFQFIHADAAESGDDAHHAGAAHAAAIVARLLAGAASAAAIPMAGAADARTVCLVDLQSGAAHARALADGEGTTTGCTGIGPRTRAHYRQQQKGQESFHHVDTVLAGASSAR